MGEGADDPGPADGPVPDAPAADAERVADTVEEGASPEPAAAQLAGLLPWAFAAFHAALLVALAVAVLFLAGVAGNQLAVLDTAVGVAAYVLLWAVAWWTNRRMVDAVGPGLLTGSASPDDVFVEAMKWGGVAGLLVSLPALVIGIVFFVGAGGVEAVLFLLVAAAVGTVIAAGVGVTVGGVFALLDLLLLGLARVWLPPGDLDG